MFSVPGAGFEGGSEASFFTSADSSFFAASFSGFRFFGGGFAYALVCCDAIRDLNKAVFWDGRRLDRAADWREDLDILASVLDCRKIEVMLG
jgi:hypothetical protein